jgi:type I restriction enzyme, S subunit
MGELADVTMGQSPPSSSYNQTGEGLPFFQGKTDFGQHRPAVRVWCAAPTKVAPAGSILMSVRAPVGDVNTTPWECCIGRGLAAINGIGIDQGYLLQYLVHAKEELVALSQGSTFEAVNGNDLRQFGLLLPPLPEQRKIAAILSSVDTAIEKTEALLAKLRDLKTAMMQELLTKGIGHTRFKDSPLGRIPEEWEVVDCAEVCQKVVVGIVIKPTQYYAPSGITLLRSANVREEGLNLTGLVYMAPEFDTDLKKSRLRTGDVVTVRTGYPGTSCVIPPSLDGANCVDLIISRPGPQVVPEYLAMWINSDSGKGQVLRAQGGLAQQHFNVGDLKRMSIALPGIAEQGRICTAVGAAEHQLRSAQKRHEKLQSLKNALMQDLLTGRVRVKVEGAPA